MSRCSRVWLRRSTSSRTVGWSPHRERWAPGVRLGGAAVALLAPWGYLISRAAQRPQIRALMVAIVAVRGFGIARAGLRYAERLSSHDLALRRLSRLRLGLFRALAPRMPGIGGSRSGELLSRFVADVDTLRDLYPRVVIPALLAVVVIAGAAGA